MTATVLEIATWLRDSRGFSVIPVDHPNDSEETNPKRTGKVPSVPWADYQKRCATDAELERWFGNGRQRNIGIVTGSVSGLVGVDTDSEEAEKYAAAHLPATPMMTRTGSGGFHRFYRHPGVPVSNRARIKTPDGQLELDVRGDGGYVIAPPSLHASGQHYARVGPWPPIDELPVFDPAWLQLEPETRPATISVPWRGDRAQQTDRARAYLAAMGPAIEGQGGDQHTFRAACAMVRDFALDETDAVALLLEWNQGCAPPWTDGEIEVKVRSAQRYGDHPVGAKLGESRLPNAVMTSELMRQPPAGIDHEPAGPSWPELDKRALYGLVGDFVRTLEPHTESDPAAILAQTLVVFGNVIGRGPHFTVEAHRHSLNMFLAVVGVSSKGRKGTSFNHTQTLFTEVDEAWARNCIRSGLSSGEGLISEVRDPILKRVPPKRGSEDTEALEVVVDEGVSDKRLLVYETEFASPLRAMERDGNSLSATIRAAWDSGRLNTMVKNNPVRATDAHISIVGHVTAEEVRRYLTRTEMGNGFANRFLWLCAKRSKCLPWGGSPPEDQLQPLRERFAAAVESARRAREILMSADARALWEQVYPDLSEGKPGMLGSAISRAEAQVRRLACLYTLLDGSTVTAYEHLVAALAMWEYAEASARYVFGDALGNSAADAILRDLRIHAETGRTRTELYQLFSGNKHASELTPALNLLRELGLAYPVTVKQPEGGRPIERWYVSKRDAGDTSKPQSAA